MERGYRGDNRRAQWKQTCETLATIVHATTVSLFPDLAKLGSKTIIKKVEAVVALCPGIQFTNWNTRAKFWKGVKMAKSQKY